VFLLWAFVTVPLALALIWVGLVLVGLVRQTDELDRRLTVVVAAMPGKINRLGLPVGALVPAFKGQHLIATLGIPLRSQIKSISSSLRTPDVLLARNWCRNSSQQSKPDTCPEP
jgi:hypothetical protein